jgi:transposase InsO family protein
MMEGANVRALCRQYHICPRTGYKWLERYRLEGVGGLADRSRRPHSQPRQTLGAVEDAVIAVRKAHPAWAGRKISSSLQAALTDPEALQELKREVGPSVDALVAGIGCIERAEDVPAPSTIGSILKRRGYIDEEEATRHKPFLRFEYAAPNELWQMDFKGSFAFPSGKRCYPLGVLDDHSRYSLVLQACADQRAVTVKEHLTQCFREYGLPERMLMDNGPPWCNPRPGNVAKRAYTRLSVWLMHLGIVVLHGRPWHPQTQGKEERFHRTLRAEVLEKHFVYHNFQVKTGTRGQGITAATLEDCAAVQALFDPWRKLYNQVRPHEALGLKPPASRFQKSSRPFPEELPIVEYDTQPADQLARVNANGDIHLNGRTVHIGDAFYQRTLLLRPIEQQPDNWQIYFSKQRLGSLSLNDQSELKSC